MRGKWERVNSRSSRKNNYPGFDKALDLHFGYDTPTNKEDLKNLMERYAFRTKDNEKMPPTDKQLEHAWEYIKKHYFPKQKEITDYYNTETTGINKKTNKPNYVYRANRNIIYKGKKYRKGQFLPKQEMLDI